MIGQSMIETECEYQRHKIIHIILMEQNTAFYCGVLRYLKAENVRDKFEDIFMMTLIRCLKNMELKMKHLICLTSVSMVPRVKYSVL